MKDKILLGVLVVSVVLLSTFLVAAVVTSQKAVSSDSKDISAKQESIKLTPSAEISQDEENDDVDDEERLTSAELDKVGSKLTEEQAVSIAKKAVDLSVVGEMTDIELEKENGVLVYAVEFTKDGIETDVKLDAVSGSVVKIESDLDEEDED